MSEGFSAPRDTGEGGADHEPTLPFITFSHFDASDWLRLPQSL